MKYLFILLFPAITFASPPKWKLIGINAQGDTYYITRLKDASPGVRSFRSAIGTGDRVEIVKAEFFVECDTYNMWSVWPGGKGKKEGVGVPNPGTIGEAEAEEICKDYDK